VNKEDVIEVSTETDVLKARRIAREMANEAGFDDTRVAEIETAVSELATNLIKHMTVQGEILLKMIENDEVYGMEVTARDKGPGIKNIESAMRGGESTAGTLGIGLSSVKRLMDNFLIESVVGGGTTIVAKKWLKNETRGMDFSVFSRPLRGEMACGDAYFIKRFSSCVTFGIIDALGHGEEANRVALMALETLEANYRELLQRIIELAHKKLVSSRGAAIALCRIDFKKKKMEHIAIGNVETRVYGPLQPVRPFCFNGTLGMAMESSRVFEYPYTEGAVIVMFSDGIGGRFDLDSYQLAKTPQEIAAFIFKEYARGTDDATVLVGR